MCKTETVRNLRRKDDGRGSINDSLRRAWNQIVDGLKVLIKVQNVTFNSDYSKIVTR